MGSLRKRKSGFSPAKELWGLSLRPCRSLTCRTVGSLEDKGIEIFRVSELGKFGLSAGAIFRVPQAERNWDSSRYFFWGGCLSTTGFGVSEGEGTCSP